MIEAECQSRKEKTLELEVQSATELHRLQEFLCITSKTSQAS